MSSPVVVKQFPVEEEYKKGTGISPEDIKRLRDWIRTQPHLPGEYVSDLDLILTYHCCVRSTEVTKQILDLQFTLKTIFNDIFKDRTVNARIEKSLNVNLQMILPGRTKEGYVIYYSHFLDTNSQNYNMVDYYKATLMILELWQFEEGTCPGLVLVLDFGGMTFGHLTKFDTSCLQQVSYFLQHALPINLRGLHIINAPAFMDRLLAVARPLLSKRLMDLMHTYTGGIRDVTKLPLEAFPKEAGGEYKSMEECREEVIAKLRAGKEFFAAESKNRVVEARRPGKPKTISDFFGGVVGSFKKLNID